MDPTVRANGRSPTDLRSVSFEIGFTRWAEGSAPARFGATHALCNVTIENSLLDRAAAGIRDLCALQTRALGGDAGVVMRSLMG